jgi:drug/metabolite transporter (DMT)-like permease
MVAFTRSAPRVSLTRHLMERWLSTERNVRVCAVLGAVTIAFSSILVRLSHASPSTSAIFRCAYALPVLGLLAWREDRRHGPRTWNERRTAVAAGVFFAADLMLWHRSIADVGAGLATVLANVQVVLVPLVAWMVLAERPGRRVLAALPVALLGVLLISGALEHGAYGRNPTRGAILGLGAGIAYVGFLLLLRRSGADLRRPAGPLFDATAVATVLCVLGGVALGDAHLVPVWPGAAWLITLALTSQVLGWLLISSSLPRLKAALVSVLLTVQPVGSVALAALILGEAPSALQLIGVGMVLAGLLVATAPLSEQVVGLRPDHRDGARAVARGDVALGAANPHHGLQSILGPREVRGSSELVDDRNPGGYQLPPERIGATAPILERPDPGASDRDIGLASAPRSPEGVGDHHARTDAEQRVEPRAQRPR